MASLLSEIFHRQHSRWETITFVRAEVSCKENDLTSSCIREVLLMEEILHHLLDLDMKSYEKWNILNINWCRISSINSTKGLIILSWLNESS